MIVKERLSSLVGWLFCVSDSVVEDSVVAANAWAVLHVHLACLALEVVTGAEDTSSEPDGVGLDQVLVTLGFHGIVVT